MPCSGENPTIDGLMVDPVVQPTHRSRSRRPTQLLVVLGVAAVSTAAVLVRLADAPALALAFWRNALGAAVLIPFALWRGRPLEPGQWRPLLAAGAVLAVHFALFIGSLSFTTVASSVVLVSASPVVVGLLSAVRRIDAPSGRKWVGIVVGMLGTVVVALADQQSSAAPAPLLGNMMALGGAAAVALYWVIGRELRRTMPVAVYSGAVYGVAAAALFMACLITSTPLGIGASWPATTWWAIAGLAVGPQLLGHTVFNAVLARVSAAGIALGTLMEPIGSAALAALLLGEFPTSGFYLGAPLVMFGVWLGLTGEQRGKA